MFFLNPRVFSALQPFVESLRSGLARGVEFQASGFAAFYLGSWFLRPLSQRDSVVSGPKNSVISGLLI